MATTTGVHITPAKVQEVKAKIAKWQAWLDGAMAVLANDLGDSDESALVAKHPKAKKAPSVKNGGGLQRKVPTRAEKPKRVGKGDPNSFMGQLVRIANEAPEPITREEHKAELRKLGFAEDRLKKPYIFAVNRTARAGRITLLSNGKVWKGDK